MLTTTVLAATPALGASAKTTAPDLRSIIAAQQKQIDALAAEVAALRAQQAKAPAITTTQLQAQQAQIDSVSAKVDQNAPTWRGGPQFNGNGWSFKPGGEIQYDFGYVSNPGNAIATSNLGYNGFVRRLMVSAQGNVPGGFTYSINLNFAGGVVGYEDVILAYQPANSKWSAQIGYMIPFNGLDNMTSNEFTSFVESSQFQDAWSNGRRIGAAIGYTTGTWLIDAGLFNGAINTLATNTDWQTAVRGVYFPRRLGGHRRLAAGYQ